MVVDGARWRLVIRDPEGRAVERFADDAEAAAAIVEGWARPDLSSPLLAARDIPLPAEIPEPPAPAIVPPLEATRKQSAAGTLDLSVSGDARLSGDGGLWAGARARVCVRTGDWCLGALAAWARDTGMSGESARLSTDRTAFDLMVVAERPLAFDPWTLRIIIF